MAANLAFALWYAAIIGKLAVVVLAVVRRIHAPAFIAFTGAHSLRSIYLLRLAGDGDAYHAARIATAPYLEALAGLAALECVVLICWRLPRFRWMAALLMAITSVFAAAVASGAVALWGWQVSTPQAWAATWDAVAGLLLTPFLGLWVLVMERFRAVDRGALHHAAAFALHALFGGLAAWLSMGPATIWTSYVSSGGALLAYVVWCWTVRGIRLDRDEPRGPLNPREVERAWGAGA